MKTESSMISSSEEGLLLQTKTYSTETCESSAVTPDLHNVPTFVGNKDQRARYTMAVENYSEEDKDTILVWFGKKAWEN